MIRDPISKIFSPESINEARNALRSAGQKLVLTNGCFDILHRGHVDYLRRARNEGDALWVLVNSDRSVRALKGPSRPINAEQDRAYVLASLESVDGVFIFDEERCTRWIRAIAPDRYAKGADYSLETLNPEERAALIEVHAEVAFIPFVDGFSSSATITRIKPS